MSSLRDKVALVTGGSRGIGRAIALALADEGVHVAFTYKSAADAAKKVVTEIEEKNQRAVAFQSDAKDLNSAVQVVDSVVKEFQRLDILVNNAGITRDTLLGVNSRDKMRSRLRRDAFRWIQRLAKAKPHFA